MQALQASTSTVSGRSLRASAAARAPVVPALGRAGLRPLVTSRLSRQQIGQFNVQRTAAAAVEAPSSLCDEERKRYAESIGYETIGKELPDNVTLSEVVKSMPPEVFELDHAKAWRACLITVVAVALSEALIAISPWYLLPFAWAFAGTAWTGMFVVGHDAAHRSFHRNNLVEDIVGTLMFMPLIYPFEPWRIKHNHHHAHTNKLVEDTAWHPVSEADVEKWGTTGGWVEKIFLGSPLKLWASIGHWWIWHFDLNKYTEKQKPRVLVSLAAVAVFAAVAWPLLLKYTGVSGFIKFWLMPWLGYHFWMSTFTVVHHTAPHIPFKPASEWNAAKAQLAGTVHCDFPRWVEFLTHDISVHIPHHVSSKIPWYNLRKAHASLLSNWGEYMTTCKFNWRMMKNIFTECHVYDEKKCYKPFDYKEPEPFFEIQRKVLPNNM